MLRIYNEYKVFLESIVTEGEFKTKIAKRKANVQAKIEKKDREAQAAKDKKLKDHHGAGGLSHKHNQ